MQNTSELYRQILTGNHGFEIALAIGEQGDLITERGEKILFGGIAIIVSRGGPDDGYREAELKSITIQNGMFPDTYPSVGNAVAGQIDVVMLKPIAEIPRMAQLVPFVRAVNTDDPTEKSEWIQKGIFYVDTRETSADDTGAEILTLHGYDPMLKADVNYGNSGIEWPAIDLLVLSEIAAKMDITIDERTFDVMNKNYRVQYPAAYTCREVLAYMAAMYAGSFIITDTGELRLVTLGDIPRETRYLVDDLGYSITFGGDRILI